MRAKIHNIQQMPNNFFNLLRILIVVIVQNMAIIPSSLNVGLYYTQILEIESGLIDMSGYW